MEIRTHTRGSVRGGSFRLRIALKIFLKKCIRGVLASSDLLVYGAPGRPNDQSGRPQPVWRCAFRLPRYGNPECLPKWLFDP